MQSPEKTPRSENARPVGLALAAATCTLLGLQSLPAKASGQPGTWDVNAGILHYQEADGRVRATEPSISAVDNIDENKRFSINLVIDSLSGASPFGATPSDQVQVFTSPSGTSSGVSAASVKNAPRTAATRSTVHTMSTASSTPVSTTTGTTATTTPSTSTSDQWIAPGETPLDKSFKDSRLSVSSAWTDTINRDWFYNLGGHYSDEHDYTSIGVTGGLSRYFNEKNTTLNLGLSYSRDTVQPIGGTPTPFSRMPISLNKTTAQFLNEYNATRGAGSENKNIVGAMFGITQVLSRRWLTQLNYSVTQSKGNLTDPYKILSVIDDQAGTNYGGNLVGADGNFVYVYEKRLRTKLEQAVYWQSKYMLGNGDIIDGSYRYGRNDWGMTSNTFTLSYRWKLGDGYLEPDVRFYRQTKADFYHRYLTSTQYNSGNVLLDAASADYRLGDMTTRTIGLKWGDHINEDQEVALRLAYYVEHNTGPAGIGKLSAQTLYPDTKAFIGELTFSF
ncbi:DUF3570 domain-containing protein [Mangrovitalea sediminis]|uniref:DUF3570 domain-containing protein n=1 Tax=Mangrovitalea sediminis TaxID=1982043 RepID=UPI000BE565D8|nr:DUF3570 domain-containing protein [Mangrovitalea sediminis]